MTDSTERALEKIGGIRCTKCGCHMYKVPENQGYVRMGNIYATRALRHDIEIREDGTLHYAFCKAKKEFWKVI